MSPSPPKLFPVICLLLGFAVGTLLGMLISQRVALANDFSRTMQLRPLVDESMSRNDSHGITLRLLDLYENGVHRQQSTWGRSNVDWPQELIEVEFRRYIIYLAEHRGDLAQQALVKAATIMKKNHEPTKDDVEFCRQ